jgi:hypothetical protein
MKPILDAFRGKKTYLSALASIAYAAAGWYLGELPLNEALQFLQVAVIGSTVRSAI